MAATGIVEVLRGIHLFFFEYRLLFGFVLIIYGLVECFYGFFITQYSMVLAGFFVGLVLGLSIPPEWISITVLRYLITVFLGTGLGVICYFQRRARAFAMGFWFLLLFGVTGLCILGINPGNKILLEMGCAGGVVYLLFDQWTQAVVVSAMMGSYIFIYGNLITWYSYSFKEMSFEFNVLSMDTRLPGILFLWILFFSMGFIFQTKYRSKYI